MSVSVVEIKTPTVPDTSNLYKLNFHTFQLPGVIPLDLLHWIDHQTSKSTKHTYNEC